jgi:aspartate 1-decarboxylase
MYRFMLKSKIHRATVTDADLNYVGSITVDAELMQAADLIENEKVAIVNNNNGERFETYVIAGAPGSGTICLNGAAARKVHQGDIVIILAYTMLSAEEAAAHQPQLVYVDGHNRVEKICRGKYE